MPHVSSPLRPRAERSGLFVVDLQERLLAKLPDEQRVVDRTSGLLKGATCLGVPFAATVQYPRGLGLIGPSLREPLKAPEEKLDFSAAVCRRALDQWAESGRDQIVVTGIETHICVEQTVLDLIAEGRKVFVVADAVSARQRLDHDWALRRMGDAGATITTTEAVLFSWCHTADRPEFKAISAIVKGFASD